MKMEINVWWKLKDGILGASIGISCLQCETVVLTPMIKVTFSGGNKLIIKKKKFSTNLLQLHGLFQDVPYLLHNSTTWIEYANSIKKSSTNKKLFLCALKNVASAVWLSKWHYSLGRKHYLIPSNIVSGLSWNWGIGVEDQLDDCCWSSSQANSNNIVATAITTGYYMWCVCV